MLANLYLVLSLFWAYDPAVQPPPEAFVITVTQGGAADQQFRVAPSPPGACDALPTGPGEQFCTQLACPRPGTVAAFYVEAVWSDQVSPRSEPVTCWFASNPATCHCQDPAPAHPPQASPPAPTPEPTLPIGAVPPPRPQQTAEGLNLHPIGPLPTLPIIPAIPPSAGT